MVRASVQPVTRAQSDIFSVKALLIASSQKYLDIVYHIAGTR